MKKQNKAHNLVFDKEIVSSRLRQLKEAPVSQGKRYLEEYYTGIKLNPRHSIVAFCCECLGFFVDGRSDCEMPQCPLYVYMPYGVCRKKYIRKGVNV